MENLLMVLWSIFFDWHSLELRKVRNSAIVMVVASLMLIVGGALAGAVSWQLKALVLSLGMLVSGVCLLYLMAQRAAIAIELATLLQADVKLSSLLGTTLKSARKGAESYVKLVAAILASELTVGLIALWLPIHNDIAMALLLLPSAIVIMSYTIWRGGKIWWPKIVYGLAIFTVIAVAVALFFPLTAVEIGNKVPRIDKEIQETLNGEIKLAPAAKFVNSTGSACAHSAGEFHFDAGKDILTVWAGPGTRHCIWANDSFIALSAQPDGSIKEYTMSKGWSGWQGDAPAAYLRLRGLHDGTIVRFLN